MSWRHICGFALGTWEIQALETDGAIEEDEGLVLTVGQCW